MIFATFFEIGEIVFDGVQVGRVRREKEQPRAGLFDQPSSGRGFVEGGVIQDDDMVRGQGGDELLLQPLVESRAGAGPLEQEGKVKTPTVHARRQQGGARTALARAPTINLFAHPRAAVTAGGVPVKTAFVDVDQYLTTPPIPFPQAQKPFPPGRVTLPVAQRFFCG